MISIEFLVILGIIVGLPGITIVTASIPYPTSIAFGLSNHLLGNSAYSQRKDLS